MNKIRSIALISLVIFFISCLKKGEDDPLISLRSRNDRLIGTWKLTEGTYKWQSNGSDPYYPNSQTTTYNDSTATETFSGKYYTGYGYRDTTYTETYSHSLELSFNKEGTLNLKWITDGSMEELNSTWNWIDNNKDKTLLALIEIDLEFGSIFQLNRLTNKELTLAYKNYDKYIDEDGDYWEGTEELEWKFEKE